MLNREPSAEELFGAALELPPDDRAAFLEQACVRSPGVRQIVQDLLDENERLGSFMEKPLLSPGDHDGGNASTPVSMATRFQPGEVIANRFEVVRFIARGGMGEVYEVKDRYLQGVPVALKIIRREIAEDAGSAKRFEQEVILARKVAHPNLCTIYDLSRCEQPAPGFLFLTMKLLSGETLDCRLKRDSAVPPDEAEEICRQLLRGTAALHEAGVLHRDIKPGNIMLEPAPGAREGVNVSLMDFGLARLHLSDSLTANSVTMAGTIGYMAPELLRGQPPSKATDLFALGIVMHQVLTGSRPIENQSSRSSNWQLVPAPALRSMHPRSLMAQAVEGLLAVEPETRYRAFAAIQSSESGFISAKTAPGHGLASARTAWIVVATLFVLAAFWLVVKLTAPPLPRFLHLQKITFSPDSKGRPLLTDGSRLYFQNHDAPAQMSINGGMIATVPGFEKGMQIRAVSPDGSKLIALQPDTVDYPYRGKLWLGSVLGGTLRRVGPDRAQDARWAPDGHSLIFAAGNTVFIGDENGATFNQVFESPGIVDSLAFSPDGKEISFAVITKDNSRQWRMRPDGSKAQAVQFDWATKSDQWFGQWTPDGKHFIFLSDHDGLADVYELISPRWFEYWKKPAAVRITENEIEIAGVTAGRDGESLYVLGQQDQGAMQVLDPATGRYVPFLDGLNAVGFRVSPDRQWMAYTEFPTSKLWRSRVDGSEPLQLTNTTGYDEQWSPDGKRLAYTDGKKIYLVSAEGSTPERLTATGDKEEASLTWMPDGKGIAFSYMDSAGKPIDGIRVVDLASRKISMLPDGEKFAFPSWSPDGQYLLAASSNPLTIMLYAARSKAWIALPAFDPHWTNWLWSNDGRFLYARLLGANDGVYRLRVPDGKWEKVSGAQGVSTHEGFGYLSLTADDRPALMSHTSVAQIYSLHWEK